MRGRWLAEVSGAHSAGSALGGEPGRSLQPEHPGLPRVLRALLLAALGATLLAGAGPAPEAPAATDAPLRSLVQSGRHPGLRWPAFPEFRSEIERLYERAAWEPLWLRGTRPTQAATQLIARLAAADSLGLEPADYDAEWLGREAREFATQRHAPSPDQLTRFDLGLSVAAVRFASALHRGRVSPRVVHAELFIPRSFLAVEMAVDSLRDAKRQGSILERLQPRLHHYHLLKNGLARYRALARDTSLVPLPAMPRVVKPGMRLRAASRLRHVLEATGDLGSTKPPDAGADTLYSAALVAGVKQFQIRQGFEPDGVIGPATAARLSRPFAQRVRQIELALERFRWLPLSFSAPPVIVNIPAFRLHAFRGSTEREDDMLAMDVVVGGAFDKHTPVFAADMRYLIFRPYWEVPVSIMRAELGPKVLSDPELLEREGMVLVRGESDRAPVLPATRENLERIGRDLRVRQLPGDQNALGLVKFLLPNAHNVYLHDTAVKGLFAKARRDFSHGCIRVSDPVALAAHVLRDQPEWTIERIRSAMNGNDNKRVNLSRPVPVCIVYTTATTHENGEVYFYSDIYGLDRKLDQLLAKGYPYPK
jgi:murein L,D-transpeptidase YcbB/YkuD